MTIKHMYDHADIIKEYFYLDADENLRRACDGYQKRYLKDDLVVPYANATGYPVLQIPKIRRTIVISHIHAILLGIDVPVGYEIDHVDGNKWNNHSSNLRVVNRRTNNCNRKRRSDNTSGVTGIRWSDYHGHYVVRRTVGKSRLSTSRKTMEEAIKALEEFTAQDPDYTARHGF